MSYTGGDLLFWRDLQPRSMSIIVAEWNKQFEQNGKGIFIKLFDM